MREVRNPFPQQRPHRIESLRAANRAALTHGRRRFPETDAVLADPLLQVFEACFVLIDFGLKLGNPD